MVTYYVFDKGELVLTFLRPDRWAAPPKELPKDSYIYADGVTHGCGTGTASWYRADYTPFREEHVPKEYRAMLLLLI